MIKKCVLVTGLAGAGKSVVMRALEDLGFFCIDNLPSSLLPNLLEQFENHTLKENLIALAVDTRDSQMPQNFSKLFETLKTSFDSSNTELLFLESSADVLIRRFSESRRPHPLMVQSFRNTLSSELNSKGNTPFEIKMKALLLQDVKLLEPIKLLATRIIDTSQMSSQFLRKLIHHDYAVALPHRPLTLQIVSFGFKYGLPSDFDSVFDARCFPNPHYQQNLRPLTGLDTAVRDFVFADENVSLFAAKIADFCLFLYPLYAAEGKQTCAVGIGCTGGKHRSVAIAESVAKKLRESIPHVTIEHRHIDKE